MTTLAGPIDRVCVQVHEHATSLAALLARHSERDFHGLISAIGKPRLPVVAVVFHLQHESIVSAHDQLDCLVM